MLEMISNKNLPMFYQMIKQIRVKWQSHFLRPSSARRASLGRHQDAPPIISILHLFNLTLLDQVPKLGVGHIPELVNTPGGLEGHFFDVFIFGNVVGIGDDGFGRVLDQLSSL